MPIHQISFHKSDLALFCLLRRPTYRHKLPLFFQLPSPNNKRNQPSRHPSSSALLRSLQPLAHPYERRPQLWRLFLYLRHPTAPRLLQLSNFRRNQGGLCLCHRPIRHPSGTALWKRHQDDRVICTRWRDLSYCRSHWTCSLWRIWISRKEARVNLRLSNGVWDY